MVLIYSNFESVQDKKGNVVEFPYGTHMYGLDNGNCLIKHPSGRLHNLVGGIYILDCIKRFFATKGPGTVSFFPLENFKHTYKHEVYLKTKGDGSYILEGTKRLWKKFSYGTISREEYEKLRKEK